jgi:hypothetical protein
MATVSLYAPIKPIGILKVTQIILKCKVQGRKGKTRTA